MDKKLEFVGSMRVKPVAQELMKLCSTGMIAISSALLLFWIQGDKAPSFLDHVGLIAHCLAIPLLVAARVLYTMCDNFERVSAEVDERLLNICASGIGLATMGYLLALFSFSKVLGLVFFGGILFVVHQLKLIASELDSPHMVRRGQ